MKKDDVITDAYEQAEQERDFITLLNLGNKHLEKKELDEAIESYEQALKIKEDEGARFKLELAMLQKKKEQKKQEPKEDKKDQKKKDNVKEESKDKVDSKKEKKSKKKKGDKE